MLRRDYPDQNCSIAATLEIVGERWTLLILREIFLGRRRFDDMQRALGVARNVLQARLERLVAEGILERARYQERPARFEYRLTERGIDLWPVLHSLAVWGDRHVHPGAAPVVFEHRDCGGAVTEHRTCARCGAMLSARDVLARLGPGALPEQGRPGDPARRSARAAVAAGAAPRA
jgi:DNA-binding HxlR family transcriptional regulator